VAPPAQRGALQVRTPQPAPARGFGPGVSVRRRLAAHQVMAASVSSNDFKPGVFIEVDGAPYRILGALRPRGACAGKPRRRGAPRAVRVR
jgi:hypothetical protein